MFCESPKKKQSPTEGLEQAKYQPPPANKTAQHVTFGLLYVASYAISSSGVVKLL